MDSSRSQRRLASPEPNRLRGEERRQQIVEVAFAVLADRGIERLRTRDVADRAGINPATLHHYFSTKEQLIEAVAAYLETLYRSVELRDWEPTPGTPREALRRQFAEARYIRLTRPEMLVVAAELSIDAKRARAASATVFLIHEHWRMEFEKIIRDGQSGSEGVPRVDPETASRVVVGALWGATTLLDADDAAFVSLCNELEVWLFGPERSPTDEQ